MSASDYVEKRREINLEKLEESTAELLTQAAEALDSGERLPGWMAAIPGPTHNNPILTKIQERYKRR